MYYPILMYGLVSFLVTLFVIPWLIKFLKRIDLVVKDQNKKNTPLVPISGGLGVLVGVFAGIFFFVFFRTFISKGFHSVVTDTNTLALLFASMLSIFIVTLVGFLDDLIVNKTKDRSSGLKQWQKPLLTFTAAVPLMAILAGDYIMYLPFLGEVNFGIFYSLLLIPIGIVGAANMVNMLAGFNGLEAGLGLVYFGMLGLYSYVNESFLAAFICLIVFSSLLAFFYFNKFPAKIFPGDSFTYLLGGALAVVAIVGNIEKAALICSIPFFVEFVLKARGRFKMQTYGYENEQGKIMSKYGQKVYSIPHFFSRTGKFTERQITYFMMFIELIFASLIWII